MFDVSFPNNDFTQMIEMTARDNARGYVRPMTASADPRPSVRSAELGREVVTTEPLTMDEKNELDRMAREAGIQDERLGNIEETGGAYATMEEALAAGASIRPRRPHRLGLRSGAPRGHLCWLRRTRPRRYECRGCRTSRTSKGST